VTPIIGEGIDNAAVPIGASRHRGKFFRAFNFSTMSVT